ncbi:MAG: hypothetical protein IJC43_04800 [Clostridia bacterium]|nr:hypothetical protein [Clostridia bacterium]
MRMPPALRYAEWSMKRKLFGYMLLLALLLLLALVAGLFLLGRFDNTGKNAYASLDVQMEGFEKDVDTHFQRLAAAGIELAEDTAAQVERHLADRGLTFAQLSDAAESIAALQDSLIEPLRQRLLQENCSGVFVMLEATINSTVPNAALSRTGLYLQQSGYKTSDKSIQLYRGLAEVGKRHGVMPHRKWRLEFRIDLFPNYSEFLPLASLPPEEGYRLTDRFTLPGTSEQAMLMAVPIVGSDGTLYGICGYEVSTSYFRTYHAQPTKLPRLICLMSEGTGRTVEAGAGLSCGVSDGYYLEPKGMLHTEEAGHGLLRFSGDGTSYLGIRRQLTLTPNNRPFTLAAIIPKADYDREVMEATLQNAMLWALILFFAVSCCLFFSRRYLTPILQGLEQIKSDRRREAQSSVPEINDLFVFLAEQDRRHEDSLHALAQENRTVQSENVRLQQEYEQACHVWEKAREEYAKAQADLSEVKKELDRLAYSRKTEIDPDDYRHFLSGMQELTPTEREIFRWYLEGKAAKEILELAGIKQGTLKFHNHNILQKLGVSSRKQMLRYAALMKQEEQSGNRP